MDRTFVAHGARLRRIKPCHPANRWPAYRVRMLSALTLDSAKNIALIVVGVLIVAAIISAKVVAGVTKKAILLLVFAALALGVFTQRQALQRCADRIAPGQETTCTIFGTDIHIKVPQPGG